MNSLWLALISTLHMAVIVINSEPLTAQSPYIAKRHNKFDVKKDSHSSYYQEPDFFELDTLAGIGLGKRSQMLNKGIAQFEPHQPNLDDNRFAFLDDYNTGMPVQSPNAMFKQQSIDTKRPVDAPYTVFRFRGTSSKQRVPSEN